LRVRLNNQFFQFIQTPQFNPESLQLEVSDRILLKIHCLYNIHSDSSTRVDLFLLESTTHKVQYTTN
jgi:hypothetical protein